MEHLARKFAEKAHAGQIRKYTGVPYITHPAAVVELVKTVPHTEEMLAAAWLHDVVEDTDVTLEDIEREFGVKVAVLVEQLTDKSKFSDGNRKIRKEIDRKHTELSSPDAKTIKLADVIDNSRRIFEHDPAFAKIYLKEKLLLMEALRGGDADLWQVAAGIVAR